MFSFFVRKSAWLLLLSFTSFGAAIASPVSIIKQGEPKAVMILSEGASPGEHRAAEELVEHLNLISGTKLPVLQSQPYGSSLPVKIGGAASGKTRELLRSKSQDPSAFVLKVHEDEIEIAGNSPEGTLFGVYELLEQLGVRWYIPGDIGRIIPSKITVTLSTQETFQSPSMNLRILQGIGASSWNQRQRLGGEPRSTGAHGIPPFDRPKSVEHWLKEKPDCFALVGNQRKASQICVSNPETLEIVVEHLRQRLKAEKVDPSSPYYVGMGPNDEGGYCECSKCRALDGGVHDPLSNDESMTDRYVWFFNQILEQLEHDYPNLRIVWYVYAWHFFPPAKLAPNPRLISSFAPITVDRIRSMDNPMSPDRHVFRTVLDGWKRYPTLESCYRGYLNPLASPQFPISQIDLLRSEIPEYYRRGFRVMRLEVIHQSWAASPISLYLAAKLMWNVNTDVDALLDEFYSKFYGPGAGAMKEYFEALETLFRDTPCQTGGGLIYAAIFKDPERVRLGEYLRKAEAAVEEGSEQERQRVFAARQSFERMVLFLEMLEASHRFDFVTAMKRRNDYQKLTDQLSSVLLEGAGSKPMGFEHRWVSSHERSDNPRSFFRRFFEPPILSGYERTVTEGKLVASFPDEWDFLIDPSKIGEAAGWQRPGKLGGNWQRLRTTSASWSDQGLHYYKGDAWYRTQVAVPGSAEGKPVYLWLGGVDEVATVWLNGHLLGTTTKPKAGLPGVPGTFRPVDFLATDALHYGVENTVTIRVTNRRLDELGTGGIVAPVMFWTPHNPAWKPK